MAKKSGGNPRSIPAGLMQVNFNCPEEVVNKLKEIARIHVYTNTEIYNQAFEKFVELYEKKNGPVNPAVKKKNIKL